MVRTQQLRLRTRGHADIHDLTPELQRLLQESGLTEGLLTVFAPSSTSAITTIENEPGALEDLRRVLDRLVPPDEEYRHNEAWGDGNGHAHIRSALLKPSLTIPVQAGQMLLGTWQQVIFIDFDVRPRSRALVVQMMGDA
ncbi:MAG TPA: secondary thiamine-phosphate synthase enzyme YjbQ [Anaerolineales bacterium]|nr:secondary thiamine-phosphate synthase enzyme YjbQ [Anaerolineales bacterium]